jgi:heme exporter protein D
MSALHWNFIAASYAIFLILMLIDWLVPMYATHQLQMQILQRLRREQAQTKGDPANPSVSPIQAPAAEPKQ